MGKGSTARPIPDRKTFEANFDAIFGKKKKPEEKSKEKKDEKKPK